MASQVFGNAKLNFASASIKGGGVFSNIPQLQEALRQYVRVRNQSTFVSVREKMANIAFKAAQYTQFSPKENIRASISSLPNLGDTKPRKGGGQFIGQYKVINWERKLKGLSPLGNTGKPVIGAKTRKSIRKDFGLGTQAYKTTTIKVLPIRGTRTGDKFMDGKFKSFIQSRIRGSKWLRIGWALAAAKLGRPFSRGDFGEATLARLDGKAYGGGATITRSTDAKTEFVIWNGVGIFDHRYRRGKMSDFSGTLPNRPESDIQRARMRQEQGLKRGVTEEIRNMVQLIAQRTSQIWYGKKVRLERV